MVQRLADVSLAPLMYRVPRHVLHPPHPPIHAHQPLAMELVVGHLQHTGINAAKLKVRLLAGTQISHQKRFNLGSGS